MSESEKIFKYISDENCKIIDAKSINSIISHLTLEHGCVTFKIFTSLFFEDFKRQLDFYTKAIFILGEQELFDSFILRIPDFKEELNEYCIIPITSISPVVHEERKTSIFGTYLQVALKKDWDNRCWKIV